MTHRRHRGDEIHLDTFRNSHSAKLRCSPPKLLHCVSLPREGERREKSTGLPWKEADHERELARLFPSLRSSGDGSLSAKKRCRKLRSSPVICLDFSEGGPARERRIGRKMRPWSAPRITIARYIRKSDHTGTGKKSGKPRRWSPRETN